MEIKKFSVNKLSVRVFKTRGEMGENAAIDAAERINRIIREKGEVTVVFAAAPSQNELLASLRQMKIDWTKVRALHMDEYIGLSPEHPSGFGNFLDKAIFSFLPFMECHYMRETGNEDPVSRYTQLIKRYPPDLVFLGVGENGHLAFNDPGVADFNDPVPVKLVELDDVCRKQQVNDGCFPGFDAVPAMAITLTMSAICKIPEKIAVVPGPRKAPAILKTLTGPITTACPASILQNQDRAVLYLDADSAAKIDAIF